LLIPGWITWLSYVSLLDDLNLKSSTCLIDERCNSLINAILLVSTEDDLRGGKFPGTTAAIAALSLAGSGNSDGFQRPVGWVCFRRLLSARCSWILPVQLAIGAPKNVGVSGIASQLEIGQK
jgi:hypothetical protein